MTRVLAQIHPTKDFCEPRELAYEYNHLYFTRYSILSAQIIAKSPFPGPECNDILRSEGTIWFTGTIYRKLKNKPDMIQDVAKISHGDMPVHSQIYSDPSDQLYIEPKIGPSMPITGAIEGLVTGCVVAVQGYLDSDHIEVQDVFALGFDAPSPAPRQRGKILFVSGLLLDTELYDLKTSLLLDWLSGYLGDTSDVTQLIVCGNSLKEPPPQLLGSRVLKPILGSSSIFDFVKLIQAAGRDLPVHLMPGDTDPAPVALPQKPFHRGLFSGARNMLAEKSLVLESNPVAFATEKGIQFLGSSGQPILDMLRYEPESRPLDLLCRTLEWRHMCPTAPETVTSFPYADSDPFILDSIPHVYFAGNMPNFDTTIHNGVRVVCVPEFASTGQVVELDLETLEAVSFTLG